MAKNEAPRATNNLVIVKLSGFPGGGSVAYAPVGTTGVHDTVMLSSKAKGDRPGMLTEHLGDVISPLGGTVSFFRYQAIKAK